MNKTIKIIDLLIKIANGEIPKKIYYDDMYFTYDESCSNYVSSSGSEIDWKYTIMEYINDEVEIIEEDKEIEEIKQIYEDRDMYDFTFWESEFQTCTDLEKKIIDNIGLLRRKQEELVKAVNELKKGN